MIRLHYVENGEDVYVNVDNTTSFDGVMREVQALLLKGIKMVGLETQEAKLFFDDPRMGNKSISGKLKNVSRTS